MQVSTRAYPLFSDLYDLFYSVVDGKTISPELIGYIDDIALAY